jgi:hypothetical protein
MPQALRCSELNNLYGRGEWIILTLGFAIILTGKGGDSRSQYNSLVGFLFLLVVNIKSLGNPGPILSVACDVRSNSVAVGTELQHSVAPIVLWFVFLPLTKGTIKKKKPNVCN